MTQKKSQGERPKTRPPASTQGGPGSKKPGTRAAVPPEEPRRSRDERYTVKPEFWDSVMDIIPPWGDEIAAVLLIVFGLVSFLSLLNVSGDSTIAAAWSNALISLFGYGSTIVCAGLLGLGIVLLLPRAGIVIRFPARRILSIEMAFFSALALLHLLSGANELRSLARLGRGGGQVGWALSSVTTGVVGVPMSVIIFSVIFTISVAIVLGVRRVHIKTVLNRASTRLLTIGRELKPADSGARVTVSRFDEALKGPKRALDDSGAPALMMPTVAQAQRVKAFHIMRVKINLESLPPSARAALLSSTTAQQPTPEELALFGKRDGIPQFNAIGTVKGKPVKGSTYVPVERPDGRLKRYFVVSGLRESRGNIRRDPALPPLSIFKDIDLTLPDEREINNNVVLIENTLLEFDIDVDVADVKIGPTVTQYAVQPYREKANEEGEVAFSRTRVSKIASLASDLALSLSAKRLRLETPIPGTNYIGIEVPNRKPSTVALRSVYESKQYQDDASKRKSPLFVPLGRDVAGAPVGIDLGQMPHLLIAGTTGSGKSVCIAALAAALLMDNSPDMVKMVMLDPKRVELSRFNGIPHLLGPVETDHERMIGVLRWLTREMDRRYKLLEESAARNIDTYNQRLGRRRKDEMLPYIVIFVDEIGDLMMNNPDETEKSITRLAQMARAVGMHMVIATQRPSVDVITGLIKANFPSRIAFSVASGTDSRVILDAVGAENLMGRGDMLYQAADALAPRRLQGCWVSDDEVREITQFWRDQAAGRLTPAAPAATAETSEPEVVAEVPAPPAPSVAPWERGLTRREFLSETDPLLEQAIALVVADQEASASQIQRKMGIGYPRAARLVDLLVELGIVGEFKPDRRSRFVLIKPGQDPFKDLIEKRMKRQQSPDSE
ncbi:MAG: DNA translocase FtsK [Pleurocapsa minor GSE-CHR-MK-17-07R]|nr:DNA translocase FtsK [Pleurocapsa minor GSE-CHR-MK 17-07R]